MIPDRVIINGAREILRFLSMMAVEHGLNFAFSSQFIQPVEFFIFVSSSTLEKL